MATAVRFEFKVFTRKCEYKYKFDFKMFSFGLEVMIEQLFGMNVDRAFNGDTVQWDGRYGIEQGWGELRRHCDLAKVDGLSSYPIVPGQFRDAEEDDTVGKPYRDGGNKHYVLKEFFDCGDADELVADSSTDNTDLVEESEIVTKSDTDNADLVEEPAVVYDGETSGALFRRCFSLIGVRITSQMDGSKRNRTSVDAYGEMMRAAKV